VDIENSILELIRGAQSGDDAALAEIWDRYFPQIVGLAGRKLAGQRRQVADEEDVAISVMESFFRAARAGRFPDLKDADGIWRLLASMTSRKAIDLIRKNTARPVVGESALSESAAVGQPMVSQAGNDPTPEVLALVRDELDHLLAVLPEEYRQIALLKIECRTVPEIAQECGVHLSTVERRLRIIRAIWAEESSE
jgi:RNA polymerase sigma factor (sigma-70 family)